MRAMASSRGSNRLGVVEGRLSPCPASPNCVSTQAENARQPMAPIPWSGPPAAAIEVIANLVEAMPRARVVTKTDHYLHAEFTTLLFRFVDDVEFFVDETAGAIHYRSASRVGHSDLGVNRRRMERLARALMLRLERIS